MVGQHRHRLSTDREKILNLLIDGLLAKLGDKDAIGKTYNKSEWNDYIIICKGNHIVHYLNGIQTVDVVDNDPKNRLMEGILALQIHAGPPMVVEFKNVRIKLHDEK